MATKQKLSTRSRLIKILKASRHNKIKSGWTRESGSGFIKEDIINIVYLGKSKEYNVSLLGFRFTWGNQNIPVSELNLSETEEALEWVIKKK